MLHRGMGCWTFTITGNGVNRYVIGSAAMDEDYALARGIVHALREAEAVNPTVYFAASEPFEKLAFPTEHPWTDAAQLLDETGAAVCTWLWSKSLVGRQCKRAETAKNDTKSTFFYPTRP